jgi:hypothetical protein
MFPRKPSSPLVRGARGALSLARSFLLLEDDYDVDWEVDRYELGRGAARAAAARIAAEPHVRADACGRAGTRREPQVRGQADAPHPHRRPPRAPAVVRRAGQPSAVEHLCLCPVRRAPATTPGRARPQRLGASIAAERARRR